MKKMMKKLCSVAILLAMVLTMMPVVAFAADAATADYTWYGDGTATTFTLNDVNDLIGFNNLMAGADGKTATTFEGKTVKLGENITFNEVTSLNDWTSATPVNVWHPDGGPDGDSDGNPDGVTFKGTFDGNGKTITGLYIKHTAKSADNTGLFAILGGTVKDLTLQATYVFGNKNYAGAIAGQLTGNSVTIENVSVEAYVHVNNTTYSAQHAGFIGATKGCTGSVVIRNCTFTGAVGDAAEGAHRGGFIGQADAGTSVLIEGCVNNASVKGRNVGGIVGTVQVPTTIINCINNGAISKHSLNSQKATGVGGIVGQASAALTIKNSKNTATVKAQGTTATSSQYNFGGGIVGHVSAAVTVQIWGCTNEGNVIAYEKTNYERNGVCGGIIGYVKNVNATVTIQGCTSVGTVRNDTRAQKTFGGVIGWVASGTINLTIDSCLIKSFVRSGSKYDHYKAGLIIGFSENKSDTTISNCLIVDNPNVAEELKLSALVGYITVTAEEKINISNVIVAKTVADTVTHTKPIVSATSSTVGEEKVWTYKYATNVTYTNVYYDSELCKAVPENAWTSKTTAALTGTAGATLMGDKWIVQDDGEYPIPAAIVQANCVELIGYQNYTTAQNGKTSYRFIAVVDELANLGVAGAMDYAGFKVSITVGNDTKTDTVWCNNAYTSLLGGVEPNKTTYRAAQYGGEYFFFFTLTNVPASTTFEITLTPFVGTSSEDADLYEGVAKTLTLTTPATSGSAS